MSDQGTIVISDSDSTVVIEGDDDTSDVDSVNGRTGTVVGLAEQVDLDAEIVARIDGDAALQADIDAIVVGGGTGDLLSTNNLSDLTDPAVARDNLGLGTAATQDASEFATVADLTAEEGARLVNEAAQQAAIDALTAGGGGDMLSTNNLSELTDPAAARANLELGSAALEDTTAFVSPTDLAAVTDALGTAAFRDVGTASGNVAEWSEVQAAIEAIPTVAVDSINVPDDPGDKADFVTQDTGGGVMVTFLRAGNLATLDDIVAGTGDMLAANNLSDVADVATSRTNLGLGTAAVEDASAFDLAGTAAALTAADIPFTPDGSIAATTIQAAIVEVRDEAASGGAPSTADFLVGTASGGLSNEIVVGATPNGELGGTWDAITVDATHSGSSHASIQAAAEATAAAALSSHEADTTNIHGIADTSLLETTAGAQAKVDAHVNDTTDAHVASAISILDTANDFTATDVEGALAELQSDHEADATALADHLADTADAHDASAVSILDTAGNFTATDAEGALVELADSVTEIDGFFASGVDIADVELLPAQITGLLHSLDTERVQGFDEPTTDLLPNWIVGRTGLLPNVGVYFGPGDAATDVAFQRTGTNAGQLGGNITLTGSLDVRDRLNAAGKGKVVVPPPEVGHQSIRGFDNTTDTLPNWAVGRDLDLYPNPGIYFGPGNASFDVTFQRTGTQAALLGGDFTLNGNIRVTSFLALDEAGRVSIPEPAVGSQSIRGFDDLNDTLHNWMIGRSALFPNVGIYFGPPNASPDVTFQRTGTQAGQLGADLTINGSATVVSHLLANTRGRIEIPTPDVGAQLIRGFNEIDDTAPNWLLGRDAGHTNVGLYLGPNDSAIDVSFVRTGAGTATVTGATTFANTVSLPATNVSGALTSTGSASTFGDGTASHGGIKLLHTLAGVNIAQVNLYNDLGDANPMAQLALTNGVPSWTLGPGGASVTDVRVTRTGTGAATVLGTLTIPAPVITGHPTIEGVVPTGATGTGNMVFASTPTLTTPVIGVATGTSLAVTGLLKSSSPSAGIGYATGAGTTPAQQSTTKASGVTANAVCGAITMDADSLNAGATATFALTNSSIAATDVVICHHQSGGTTGAYNVWVSNVAAGSCSISVRNMTAGALAEAPVLGFAVIKAVAA